MNKILLFLSISFMGLLIFSSCDKDDKKLTGFQLNFSLVYDGEPINDKIPYRDGEILMTKFLTYLTNIEVEENGKVLASSDVALLTLIDENKLYTFNLDAGDIAFEEIDKISFDIGIPSHLNAKKPSDYDSDHILSDLNNYWDAWSSYIFSKTEGKFFTNEGTQSGFAFHTGSDETFTPASLEFEDDYDFGTGKSNIDIVIDLKKLFEDENNNLIDLEVENGFHELDEIEAMKAWNKKLAKAFSIVKK